MSKFCVLKVNRVLADLQLQTLVQHHPALNPGLLQVGTLTVKSLQLLLDLRAGVVATGQKLLSKLLKGLEGACTSIDLSTVFLQDLRCECLINHLQNPV